MRPEVADSHKHGELNLISYANNSATGRKVFGYLFERLGGFQIRQWEFHGGASDAPQQADEDLVAIDEGFTFIEIRWRDRKIGSTGFEQLKWATSETKKKEGPLLKWSDRLVKGAIGKLRDEGALAKTITKCPNTIKTLAPWFIDGPPAELAPFLKTHAFGLVGKAGSSKSPVIESIACMFSRFWLRTMGVDAQTSYRISSDFDFFRGEIGCVDRPDALDDADPRVITPAKFKAFTDVGLVESMSRERWGASKWVRNQFRLFGFNPINTRGEPPTSDSVTHEQFRTLLDHLWHKEFDYESKMAPWPSLLRRISIGVPLA